MANYFYKGKEVRSRSDRDRDVKLSGVHTVTLKHTDINFRVTDSVAIQLLVLCIDSNLGLKFGHPILGDFYFFFIINIILGSVKTGHRTKTDQS